MSLSSGLKCKGFVQGQRKLSVITKRMSAERGSNLQPQNPVKRTELKAWSACSHARLVPLSTTITQLIMFQSIRVGWEIVHSTPAYLSIIYQSIVYNNGFFSPQFKRYYLRFIKFSCERVNYAVVKTFAQKKIIKIC